MGKYSLERMPYPSDVTDEEWEILEPLIPGEKPGGRPQEIARREIVNAILYVLRSSCPWRMLPHDLPRWFTAHWYFRQWKQQGIWEQVNAALRRELRVSLGREAEPSAAIIDSQSIKTSSVRGDERGFDGGKKNLGQKTVFAGGHEKRLVIAAKVLTAHLDEREGGKILLLPMPWKTPSSRA